MKDEYKVALYLRLSRDDGRDDEDESMSITNQRNILEDYAKEKGWLIEDTYADDGYSGTNFDRPEFQRMISDIENKRINIILVKDLSRFARNGGRADTYIEEFFPENGVRLIAVNDNIDTIKENDLIAFYNFFNEQYARDISRKTKTAKLSKAKRGLFLGSQPPYGYEKVAENKNRLVIDEYSADIVRKIFNLYSLGTTSRKIAQLLSDDEVLTPRDYQYYKNGKVNPYNDTGKWNSQTIMSILKSQVYIGNMVSGKRRNLSYKSKKRLVIPEEEWIVIEDTHDRIIDIDLWEKTQKILDDNKTNKRQKTRKDGEISLFSGKLRCKVCGAPMICSRYSTKTKSVAKYRCSTYVSKGKKACGYNAIEEEALKYIVKNEIKQYARLTIDDEESLLKKFELVSDKNIAKTVTALEKKKKISESENNKLQLRIDYLLDNAATGNISDKMMKSKMDEYEEQQNKLEAETRDLEEQITQLQNSKSKANELVKKFRKYIYIEDLDRQAVVDLIDYIEVSEADKVEGIPRKEIVIHFNFIGEISEITKLEKQILDELEQAETETTTETA